MDAKRRTELVPFQWGPMSIFEELERFINDRTMDLDRFWFPQVVAGGYRVPAIDLREEGDRYVLTADLPGMSKEDVNIEIGDGVVEITAKKETSKDEEKEGYIRKERGSMYYHRRLAMPENVDTEGISAKLNNGVLELTLPKVKEAERAKRKVDIQ
ncbi:MAG: Hsp20/alpha crystallin family protein [Methanomassiliicoccales archaeon]|nr:MAG: Hsp20/alpha crystallin family protein [Methanomassiliicoccales archaeon]